MSTRTIKLISSYNNQGHVELIGETLQNEIVCSKRKREDFGTGIVRFKKCNFRCTFCFAKEYSYKDIEDKEERHTVEKMNTTEEKYTFDEDLAQILYNKIKQCDKSKGNRLDEECEKCKGCNKCKEEKKKICDKHNSPYGIHECNGIKYIQITGGETLLNLDRVEYLVKVITYLNMDIERNTDLNKNIYGIIIQTNGSFIGSESENSRKAIEELSKLKGLSNLDILFEVSIKGTNEEEFKILTGVDKSKFYNQIRAFDILSELEENTSNISAVARLGTGHHHISAQFIYPDKSSMFLRNKWSKEFSDIYEYSLNKFNNEKMVAECINAEGDGGGKLDNSMPAICRCIKNNIISFKSYNNKTRSHVENMCVKYKDKKLDISEIKRMQKEGRGKYKEKKICDKFHNCNIDSVKLGNEKLIVGNYIDDYKEFISLFRPMTGTHKLDKKNNTCVLKDKDKGPNLIYLGRSEFKRVK